MIYIYNTPTDGFGMYLEYFKAYIIPDEEYLAELLRIYKYISTKKPEAND